MKNIQKDNLLTSWLSLNQIQMTIANELESVLQEKHQLSLKEFYLLLFLFEAPEQKLRLQQLESMVGLSQSAMSRLVSRFEAKGCGALKREICEADRRAVYTALTEIGEAKLEKALVSVRMVLEKFFAKPDIQAEFQKLIHSAANRQT
ncbi:MarR family winged helix-turn-helix transcriptional regulator [Paenibacillus caui]|uniref:MarR family winged helix-turn-helix transcriptional regulator n=1 Tax=Paenibacillus caui TaxID=2873927 RepID=UPI001CAA32A1|nr:MarR family transcriptional regulator [Paenibacillus caui]